MLLYFYIVQSHLTNNIICSFLKKQRNTKQVWYLEKQKFPHEAK